MFSMHVPALGVLHDELGPQPLHGLAAQRVVGHHGRLVHAQQREHDGRQDPGAVLAGGAVEDGGQRVRVGEDLECSQDLAAGVAEHLLVLRAEQAGPAVELLRVGQLLDEGEVVEGHRVRVDVEAAALQLALPSAGR